MAKTIADLFKRRPRPPKIEERILAALGVINARMRSIMTLLDDIKAKLQAAIAAATANTDATAALTDYINALKGQIATLQTQLAEAVANSDTAALQAISEGLDGLAQSINADAAVEAALAGTEGIEAPTE